MVSQSSTYVFHFKTLKIISKHLQTKILSESTRDGISVSRYIGISVLVKVRTDKISAISFCQISALNIGHISVMFP